MNKLKLKDTGKLTLSLVLGLAVAIFMYLFLKSIGTEKIQEIVEKSGLFGPIIFVLLHAFTVIFSPFGGGGVLTLSAGILFGIWGGMFWFIMGSFLGSFVNFWLARILGKPFLAGILGKERLEKTSQLATKLTSDSRLLLLIILMSTTAFNLLCYACGLTQMKFKKFFLAVLISSLINTPIYVIVGQNLVKPDQFSFLATGIMLSIMTTFLLLEEFYYRKFSKKLSWLQRIKQDLKEF